MGMHTTKVAVGEGKFALEAQLTVTPRGMVVYACSPEFAHLGATAQAIPRPEPGRTATVSILAVPCHRDEIPAHDIAAALATRFGVPVTASTGFHVEHANKDDLQRVLDTTKELIAALEETAARTLRAGWDEGGEETVAQVLRFKLAARADDSNCLSAEDPRANNRVTVHDVCAVDAVRIVMGAVAQAIHIAGINCEAGICVGSHGRSFRSVSR